MEEKKNKFGVVKRESGIFFARPIPGSMPASEALFFAAYIVAALDKNGYDFGEILRSVRKV